MTVKIVLTNIIIVTAAVNTNKNTASCVMYDFYNPTRYNWDSGSVSGLQTSLFFTEKDEGSVNLQADLTHPAEQRVLYIIQTA